ncbi:MAG TPA: hypothetical protein VD963_07115 [Phycisphaerales bacterium]|nr:hypothetical protein [Phycisphaerales bacterium]
MNAVTPRCARCGYDLSAQLAGRRAVHGRLAAGIICPECGEPDPVIRRVGGQPRVSRALALVSFALPLSIVAAALMMDPSAFGFPASRPALRVFLGGLIAWPLFHAISFHRRLEARSFEPVLAALGFGVVSLFSLAPVWFLIVLGVLGALGR